MRGAPVIDGELLCCNDSVAAQIMDTRMQEQIFDTLMVMEEGRGKRRDHEGVGSWGL